MLIGLGSLLINVLYLEIS